MRMPKPPDSKRLKNFQRAARIYLKQNTLKTEDFQSAPESALGAGGRAFESPRPDQQNHAGVNFVDPLGLYIVARQNIPLAEGALDALFKCIERETGETIVLTSTRESTSVHDGNNPHTRGEAADVRYPNHPYKFLCAASKCGAGYAQDEKIHPSNKTNDPHMHIQPGGGLGNPNARGDLPRGAVEIEPAIFKEALQPARRIFRTASRRLTFEVKTYVLVLPMYSDFRYLLWISGIDRMGRPHAHSGAGEDSCYLARTEY